MSDVKLKNDPHNLIIAGVGGQGNVLASRLLGQAFVRKGCFVTIGESFGVNQRGGSVSSHIRISSEKTYAPMIPSNSAHSIIGLEATETLRIIAKFGNPGVNVICNTRPFYPVSVICGDEKYPSHEDIRSWMTALSEHCLLLDATSEAMKLGSPIYGNIIMIGALAGTNELPLTREEFEAVVGEKIKGEKLELNMKAFDLGMSMAS